MKVRSRYVGLPSTLCFSDDIRTINRHTNLRLDEKKKEIHLNHEPRDQEKGHHLS